VVERGGKVLQEDILIHHYGYDPDRARRGDKAARYLAIARRKMEAQPENVKALHDFAEQALACNLVAEAETACRKALALDARDADSATTLANILLNRGEFGEARAVLEVVAARDTAPPHMLTALAAIDCREGRVEDARRRLDAALEADPKALMAHVGLARVFDRQGHPAHALRELEMARDLAPKLVEFQNLVRAHTLRVEAEDLFQNGFFREALAALVEGLRLDPEDPFMHNDLGVVLHALGQVAKARESFERALRLAPGLAAAEANLARLARDVDR
ncbi:MAG TPA: tetratricopeptide repeat protein, partial [Candidatus Hydrogenedentes bacterium]|nr:tetratricopeptide repeat protein [Candidatus Hydrogenedentota bacterium]